MSRDRTGAGRKFREQRGLDFAAAAAPVPAPTSPPASAPTSPPAPAPNKAARDDVQGHRARLRRRFIEGGPAGVADYEMLELVLFRAIPQRDVKPLAKRLIVTFGDFNGAVSAPPARLAEVQGIGPAVICELKIVEAAAHRLARARVMHRHALSSWAALMEYCRTTMAHRDTEQFRILFLDRKNVLIADEEQARGTVDQVPIYPREVVKRALELNASAIIPVHNHPSGDPTPSASDVDMTRQVDQALRSVGIVLHDHVIVGRAHDSSFRSQGLL